MSKSRTNRHSTRITFNAKIVPNGDRPDQATLEFDGLVPVCLDGLGEVKIYNPEDGTKRDLHDEEVKDFEDAVQHFVDIRLARQLRKFIAYTRDGGPTGGPEEY